MTTPQIDHSPTRDGSVHRWEMPRWWLPFMIGILLVLLVFGSVASVNIMGNEGWIGAVFVSAWFAALAWNVYWWLFRVAYWLELRDETLHWRAPLSHGELSVRSITEVAPFMGTANQMPTIRAVGRRSVPIFAYGDLSSFLARLNVINGAVPNHVEGFAGFYDRLTSRSANSRLRRRSPGP